MWTISSDGDAGDIIFEMALIQELTAGPHTLLVKRNDTTTLRTPEAVERFYKITKRLVLSQPYIKDYRIYSGEPIDWDAAGFRARGLHYMGLSLLECHSQDLQMTKGIGRNIRGTRKWLTIEPSMETKGMVVINRTSRYNNSFFPWPKIVEHYQGRLLFIGLEHEWQTFCTQYGKVSWRETSDLLEMAQLIAGSSLFIGNQSSANALCEGMKHNLIQETALHIPDCVFRRPNAQHVGDGGCTLPDVSGSGTLVIPPIASDQFTFQTHRVPPDGWQYEDVKTLDWNALCRMTQGRMEFAGKTTGEVAQLLMQANWKRKPEFFRDPSFDHLFTTFRNALQTASVS